MSGSGSKNHWDFMRAEAGTLVSIIVMGICLGIFRSKFTTVSEHDPTEEQLVIPKPPFCDVPDSNLEKLFYFDLGGTYCLCEKQVRMDIKTICQSTICQSHSSLIS
jgi:hypothetical protein